MNQKIKHLRTPIYIALIFSFATVFLFEFGSYDYPEINRGKLYLFLLCANLAMIVGFCLGTLWKLPDIREKKAFPIEGFLRFLFWVALISCVPKFALYTGIYDFDPQTIVSKALEFFSNAQDIYSERQDWENVTGVWKYINYGVVIAGPFYWAYTPLAIMYWNKLKTWRKIATLGIWFLYLLQYMCTGTNVGFFDFFITLWVVNLVKRKIFNPQKKTSADKEKKKSVLIITVVVIIVLIMVFGIIMGSRIGHQYTNGVKVGNYMCPYNPDSLVNSVLPSFLEPMAGYFTRYVAQAYNALAMAFDMPFETTYGVGHSWFILDNMGSMSDEMWSRTYNMKLDRLMGYNYYGNWHTSYLWFANDVSIFGVPVVFLVLFTLFGRCWKEFVCNKNLISFLMFMIFVKLVTYISANNQVFMNSDTLFAFWVLIAALGLISSNYSWGEVKVEI